VVCCSIPTCSPHPKDYAARRADALFEEQRLFDLAASRSPELVLTGLRAGGSDRSSAEPSRFIEQRAGSLPETNAVDRGPGADPP
jgi:hypothetical protein